MKEKDTHLATEINALPTVVNGIGSFVQTPQAWHTPLLATRGYLNIN